MGGACGRSTAALLPALSWSDNQKILHLLYCESSRPTDKGRYEGGSGCRGPALHATVDWAHFYVKVVMSNILL